MDGFPFGKVVQAVGSLEIIQTHGPTDYPPPLMLLVTVHSGAYHTPACFFGLYAFVATLAGSGLTMPRCLLLYGLQV